MNYNRKLKIYYEFDIKPSNDFKFEGLINFIEKIFQDINPEIIEKKSYYKNWIRYKNIENKTIFLHDLKNNSFWINEILVWNFFYNYLEYYIDIREIMKYIIFKKLNLKNIKPKSLTKSDIYFEENI